MGYNLFLDDVRDVSMVYSEKYIDQFIVVRNFDDFVNYIKHNGIPDFISFDNDLGLDDLGNIAKEGYDAVKWLIYDSNLDLSKLKFEVHSANPVARNKIRNLLNHYQLFIKAGNVGNGR